MLPIGWSIFSRLSDLRIGFDIIPEGDFMIDPALFDAVRGSILLHGMDDADLARLAVVCEERHMAEGTTVFIENMPGESLFLIRQGTIRISKMFAEGDEQQLVIIGPAELLGEMAVVDGLPRTATARVVENAELISLKKKDFEALCQDYPALALKLVMNTVRVFSRRVRDSNDEYRDMLIWSIQSSSPAG
jgi:CRP-like cAMP-binding protein